MRIQGCDLQTGVVGHLGGTVQRVVSNLLRNVVTHIEVAVNCKAIETKKQGHINGLLQGTRCIAHPEFLVIY